ncbi:RNA polymerase sigma factor [Marivivens marinus]|uniref:RNA polymerase sigma factor n=1 Tax=Marivivens marinus TaxID=3110173 RepID=UPI003B846EE0
MSRGSTQKERALLAYLAAGARIGDRSALDRLCRLLHPVMLAHATRLLQDREGARDAAQSALADVIRALPSLRDPGAVLPFALRITARRVARVIGHRQRDRRLSRDWANEADTDMPPTGPDAADARAVRAALGHLSPDHRATIALFYLHDMTVAEAAAALDVPPGTVKTRLMHARAKLRDILGGVEDD